MTTNTQTFRSIDVALPSGATLRVGLLSTDGDKDGELVLACGWPARAGWTPLMAEGVNIPASALPALRDALAALGDV
jgi:hypothetical protein